MFENLLTFENGIAFLTLACMEIVLGIDNLIYIAIVSSRLPKEQQPAARKVGLAMALVTRLLLLFTLSYIVNHLQEPVFELTQIGVPVAVIERLSGHSADEMEKADGTKEGVENSHAHAEEEVAVVGKSGFAESNGISWKDIVLFVGGLFLLWKSIHEIHEQFGHDSNDDVKAYRVGFLGVVSQIAVMDIVFSLDSVITAVGMAKNLTVMVGAIIVAVIVMLIFAERVSRFVEEHPTLKVLALSFLILIGVMLVAEGVGAHLDKGYIYFAIIFSLGVEFINMRSRPSTPSATT